MNANKIKNGVIALIKEACLRLRLEPIEFMRLYEQVSGREQPALTFASCCLHLEKNPTDSKLRTLLQSPEKFSFAIGSTDDNCYSLLYDMVTAFYTNSPTSFFVRAARFEAPPLMVLSRGVPTADGVSEVKCTVCGQSMFNTTSGWVCDNGHGGAEDPLNPKTWELDLEAMLRHADPGPVRRETNSEDVSGVIAASDIVKEQDRRRQDIEFGGEAPERKYDPVARPTIPWNDDQNKAFKSVWRWLNDPRKKPIFRMFGFAGTGKTSMAKEIAWVVENGEGVPRGLVLFAAYSGKAAAVLRSKGCTSATTIHSLIYKPQIDRDTGQVTGFTRNGESPLRDCALLIVDEVSMVNEEMAMDLMSYGVAILVLGDPGQLKPIKGEGYFTQSREDIMLTSVERTAKDDPITYLATLVREGKRLKPGRYGESRVYAPGSLMTDKALMKADQVLVGMRNTRDAINRRVRIVNGRFDIDSQFPVKGDRLMCLKNNKQNGLMNGTIWQCTQPQIKVIRKLKDFRNPKSGFEDTNIEGLHFKVRSYDMFDADGRPLIVNTVCSTHHFDTNLPEPNWRDIAGTDQWGFAYACTVHKAQGSQWDHVLVVDQSDVFQDQIQEHLYTAITRAAKSVKVFL